MKAKVYGLDGTVTDERSLPAAFEQGHRPDVIRKAFNVMRANARQPYGVNERAGKQHPVEPWSTGRGVSRVPRLTQGRRAAFMPGTVGGRTAHPPKPEKNWEKKINKKEKALARRAALAATASPELVAKRGHRFGEDVTLPLVVDNEFEQLTRTKDMIAALQKLGVYDDVERARRGRHIRAGTGKRRGRRYKTPRSVLIVAGSTENVKKAAGNLMGVDVVSPQELNVLHLAPGGDPGRLTIFTVNALEHMEDMQ
ncbi:MAG: 50S ribosomal protein L4 [Thermoplasmatota archaeon]